MKIGGGNFGDGNSFDGDRELGHGRSDSNSGTSKHGHTAEVIPAGDGFQTRTTQRTVIPTEGDKHVVRNDGPTIGAASITNHQKLPVQPVIHVTVFAKYQQPDGEQLIKDVGYLNAASGQDFHLVLAGYSPTKPAVSENALTEPKIIQLRPDLAWYYDDHEFLRQVHLVEEATTWTYAGGLQLLICDVAVSGRRAANTREMFVERRALLENVIVVDVDELKENKLFADFERFFAALRTIIREIKSTHSDRLTWRLSDRLALTQSGVALKTLAKAFKLDLYEAFDAAKSLKSFAVRDIRRSPKKP